MSGKSENEARLLGTPVDEADARSGRRRTPLRKRVRPRTRLGVTREGWFFILISVAIGLAAIRSGNNLLFLILGMMLGLLVASGILSEISLRGLELKRQPPTGLHAARPFLMGISITNKKRFLPSFSIEVEDIYGDRVLDKRCYFLKIPAGRTQSTSYRHAFARRGVYRASGFKISTKFPFALLRKSRVVEVEDEILVFPAVRNVSLGPLPAPESFGINQRRARGRGGDVAGVRDYRPGDDPREIHWKVTAHRGRLMARERDAEAAQVATVSIDNQLWVSTETSYLRATEEVEAAIGQAASVASDLIAKGYRVAVISRSGGVPVGGGPRHLVRILRVLATLEYADPDAPLPRAIQSGPLIQIGRDGATSVRLAGGGVTKLKAVA